MKKRVLLSIHPSHAYAIFSGDKGYEFRRVLFKKKVQEILVYATAPVSRVIGKFRIDEIYHDAPDRLWQRTKSNAGISKEAFDNYFENKEIGFAIKILNSTLFLQPQPLSRYITSGAPPQSFCYV